MTNHKKIFRYNLIAIGCASIFFLTSWMWPYLMNLFVAYPIGLIGLFFWNKGKVPDQKNIMGTIAISLLAAGLFVSFAALLLFR